MTKNTRPEPSDARVEEMLRVRAGDGTPRDLVAAISTAIETTRQSPRRLRARLAPRGRGNAGVLLAAAVIVGAAVGSAIIGGTKLTAPDRAQATDDVVQSPPSSSAPASPRPSAAAPAGVAHDFGKEPALVPYLFSDDVGWVTTATSVYRTMDDGRTWVDLTPQHVGPLAGTLVVDASTAIVASGEGPNVSIAATHDAGATWTTSTVNDGAYGPLLLFSSTTDGTVTFFDTTYAMAAHVHVYRTTDGGRTWSGPTPGTFPARQVKPGGWGAGAIWLNEGKADNAPFDDRLWVSTDGGVTWPARRFPTTDFAQPGELKWVAGSPWFGAGGQIVMAISNGDKGALFRSDDDGQSWQLVKSWTEPGSGYVPLRLSSDEWVLVGGDGTSVLSTTDAGASWRTITGERPIHYLSNPTFASPDHGWALHDCERGKITGLGRGPDPYCDGNTLATVLLETTDGGKSWNPLAK
jgi:photosystem II stability/assembly factor-like uncharacterized protein